MPAAGDDEGRVGSGGHQRGDPAGAGRVVDQDEEPPAGAVGAVEPGEFVQAEVAAGRFDAERAQEAAQHLGRVLGRALAVAEVGVQLAVREPLAQQVRGVHGECGLADAGRSGEEGAPGAGDRMRLHQAHQLVELVLPAGEVGQVRWQHGGRGGPQHDRFGRRLGGVLREAPVQDAHVDAGQRLPGVDAELLQEDPAPGVEDGERVGLPAAAVEGGHQLGPQPLPHRVLGGQAGQVGHQPVVPAEGQLGLVPVLQGREVQLLQPRPFDVGEVLGDIGEGRAAHQVQRAAQFAGGLGPAAAGQCRAAGPGGALELGEVEPGPVGPQQVAARAADQLDVRAEPLAQP